MFDIFLRGPTTPRCRSDILSKAPKTLGHFFDIFRTFIGPIMLPKMSKKCLLGLARHADPGRLGEKMSLDHTGSEGSSHQMSHCQLGLGRPFHNMSHTPLVREGAPTRRHVNNRVPGTDPTEGPMGPWEPCCERVTGGDRPGWPVAVPQMANRPYRTQGLPREAFAPTPPKCPQHIRTRFHTI